MQLRSDAIKRGLARAPHRSLLKADGLTDEELDRPLVAVVSAQNEVIPGHLHLQQIADAVKAGVRMAGGTPLQVNTIGVCDGIAMNHEGMKYSLTSREVIADSVECAIQGHQFDAMVLIPSCDKIVPGMLIAACRLNIPTVLVSGGPMLAGRGRNGEQTDLNSLFDAVGQVTAGTMTEEECHWLEGTACPTCGSCSGMFTANSICCLSEALGIALPGNGTIPAVYSERIRLAKHAGMKVMELLRAGTTAPRHHQREEHPERHGVRHGLRRLHQHHAPPDRHRPGGRLPRHHAGLGRRLGRHAQHRAHRAGPARSTSRTSTPWAAWAPSWASSAAPATWTSRPRPATARCPPTWVERCPPPTARSYARVGNAYSPTAASRSCAATSRPTAASSRRARSPQTCAITAARPRLRERGGGLQGHLRRQDHAR